MPIYEYECLTCGVMFEKRQSFNEVPKADCPNGHPETRRLLAAPAIVFKGTGFYVNDSKGKNSANGTNLKGEKAEGSSETKTESKETKSESKSDSSPKTD
jgi:putative FmdB family regulatory protein